MPKGKSKVKHVSVTEAMVLACLAERERYGTDIKRQVEKRFARSLPDGSIYTTLARMMSRKLISARVEKPSEKRKGKTGNRRKFCSMTADGKKALVSFRKMVS